MRIQKHMKASDRLYSELRQRLMTGYYTPGVQLKEHDIASEFDVSRTPVRNALTQLVEERLLVAEPNRGVFVAEWTAQDVGEVFRLRRMLESHGAGLAALHHSQEQLKEFRTINRRMEQAVSSADLNERVIKRIQLENNLLHRAILQSSKSPRLIGISLPLVDTPMVIRSFFLYNRGEMEQSVIHHNQIIDAIASKDYDFAFEVMSFHLRSTYKIYASKHK